MEHDDRTGKTPDGAYRLVRPEAREALYRDAGVESTQDAAQLPRCYRPPQKEGREKKEKPSEQSHRGLFAKAMCMCLVCAVLGGAVGSGITAALLARQREQASVDQPLNDRQETQEPDVVKSGNDPVVHTAVTGKTMDLPALYDMACEQVVGITTEVTRQNFWGMVSSSAVVGSGFVISQEGYILTNYHVIEAADLHRYEIKVMRHDGTAYTANIVGTRPDNDIAVLQIEGAENLSAAELGNSDAIRVGDTVHAVGNPMGELEFTMTNGAVSALDRVISTSEAIAPVNMFQIDAAVNTGNSGGPVYNDAGEVIGVVTAKYSKSGVEGLGFAIPINDAIDIANDLIAHEDAGRAYLGVYPKTMSAAAALYYNTVPGAYVSYVEDGSAAQRAGILPGDVICQIGSIEIGTAEMLQTALRGYHAGDTVEIIVYRGDYLTVTVELDAQPETDVQQPEEDPVFSGEDGTVYAFRSAASW